MRMQAPSDSKLAHLLLCRSTHRNNSDCLFFNQNIPIFGEICIICGFPESFGDVHVVDSLCFSGWKRAGKAIRHGKKHRNCPRRFLLPLYGDLLGSVTRRKRRRSAEQWGRCKAAGRHAQRKVEEEISEHGGGKEND